mmetsp:Transcript_42234/g.127612  ORF Transcript_42234/g.127612 Transcript_42234/m.127612 type:complete len:204 (+) Transcript_42234:1072-1683(+)
MLRGIFLVRHFGRLRLGLRVDICAALDLHVLAPLQIPSLLHLQHRRHGRVLVVGVHRLRRRQLRFQLRRPCLGRLLRPRRRWEVPVVRHYFRCGRLRRAADEGAAARGQLPHGRGVRAEVHEPPRRVHPVPAARVLQLPAAPGPAPAPALRRRGAHQRPQSGRRLPGVLRQRNRRRAAALLGRGELQRHVRDGRELRVQQRPG